MKTIDLYSLPAMRFAHTHSCDSYQSIFSPRENIIEVSYISAGELHIETEQQCVVAKQNDIICLLHNSNMRICSKDFHSHHTVCANVDWKYLDSPVSGFYLPILTTQSLDTSHIRQLIDSFIYGQNSYEESHIRNAYQFLTILAEIDALYQKTAGISLPKNHIYVERAKKYVHKHLHEQITQAQVAEHLGITPGYLCSLFKNTQRMSLIHYINRTKLEAISQIMEREHLKLYEAAERFGYTDANYVSRLYKKMFHHSITSKPNRSDNM